MPRIDKDILAAAINAPFLARDPRIRMYPFAGTVRASAGVGQFPTIYFQPTPNIATVIRKVIFGSNTSIATRLFYNRVMSALDAKPIIAAFTDEGGNESPRAPLLLQTQNRTDQTGKGLVRSGFTTVAPSREQTIYRHADEIILSGGVNYPAAPRHVMELNWPIILWGDDSSGLPAFMVQQSSDQCTTRLSYEGEEWPLFTEPEQYK